MAKKSAADRQAADRRRAVAAMVQATRNLNAAMTEMEEAAIHFANADIAAGLAWSVDAATVRDFARQLAEFSCCDHGEAGFAPYVQKVAERVAANASESAGSKRTQTAMTQDGRWVAVISEDGIEALRAYGRTEQEARRKAEAMDRKASKGNGR